MDKAELLLFIGVEDEDVGTTAAATAIRTRDWLEASEDLTTAFFFIASMVVEVEKSLDETTRFIVV